METFMQALARKGIADPKIRSVRANWASHARYGVDKMRKFPQGYGTAPWPMVETVDEDGTVRIDYQGDPVYSAHQIAEYVRKFCELNHLKG